VNLQALDFINKNCVEILGQSARENNADEETIKGIARDAVANGYDSLSDKQKYHFDKSIRKLIEKVSCSGFFNPYSGERTNCRAILPDENLVEYYESDSNYCEACQAEADYMAYRKERIEKE
jgi:hypothetical protein